VAVCHAVRKNARAVLHKAAARSADDRHPPSAIYHRLILCCVRRRELLENVHGWCKRAGAGLAEEGVWWWKQ
jgi:hypothetical protein